MIPTIVTLAVLALAGFYHLALRNHDPYPSAFAGAIRVGLYAVAIIVSLITWLIWALANTA